MHSILNQWSLHFVLMQERRDPVAEMEERRAKEKQLIKESFHNGKDVCLQNFYFIDFQSLYEIADREDIRYLPCEVAIVEYSLHSGHSKHFHKFIDPGMLLISVILSDLIMFPLYRVYPYGLSLPSDEYQ